MNLLASFKEYVDKTEVDQISKELGFYPSIVKRWKAKTHAPKLDVLNAYYEKIFSSHKGTTQKGNAHVEKASAPPQGREALGKKKWNPEESVVSTKKICLLFPCYKTTNPATAWALFAMGLEYGKNRMTGFMELGNALIYKTRNKLADQFVESGAEYSIWIDDDIIFPIGRAGWFRWINNLPASFPESFASRQSFDRLMSHNKTFVSGLYFGRQKAGNPMFHEGLKSREANMAARTYKDELRATEWVPTGFKMVHRSVYEDIRKKFPELAPSKTPGPEGSYWGYYNPIGEAGEDVSFCIRAKKAGHQPYIDLGLHATHVGYAAYGAHNTLPPSQKPNT